MRTASPASNRITSQKNKQISKDGDQKHKDISYRPVSEAGTEAKQTQSFSPPIDADAADHVNVAAGTG
jgi:hypothetical protein